MRKHLLGLVLAVVIFLSCAWIASAQTKPSSGAPTAPSTFDPHDLSGIWFDERPRPITTNERYWIYKFNAEEPPMTAWGEAQYKGAKSSFGTNAYPLAEPHDP